MNLFHGDFMQSVVHDTFRTFFKQNIHLITQTIEKNCMAYYIVHVVDVKKLHKDAFHQNI